MKRKEHRENLQEHIKPVVKSLGYAPADISTRRSKGTLEVHLIIAKPGGISLDDCALVHTTVLPKIEILHPDTDIRLEVSSPGLNRVIKWVDELPSYTGMTVHVLPPEPDTWVRGTLTEINDSILVLATPEGNRKFAIADIRKAKLESMEEAEE